MQKFFLTPGPSQLYFTVEEHIRTAMKSSVASISHRSKAFEGFYSNAVEQLKTLLDIPENYHLFFTSSATEIWERSVENLVARESFHLVNGAFSKRYAQISKELGRTAHTKEVQEGTIVDIESLLIPETAEMICVTHNETSTGAMQPIEDIYKLRKAFPEQLLAVDMVSSCPDVNLDLRQVDMAYFSVQKCFGLPAGLGVWLLNDRCMEKAIQLQKLGHIGGSYHSVFSLLKKAHSNQTPETPNVLNIYLLGKVAEDMNRKGIDQIRRETAYKAAVLYQAIESHEDLEPFVQIPGHRSRTTIVASVKSGDNSSILQKLDENGFVAGKGYGSFKSGHIRIANFPAHSKEQMERVSDILMDS